MQIAASLFSLTVLVGVGAAQGSRPFKYVALFSVDGMHSSDLTKYAARGPSNISMLLEHGYKYTAAYTTDPSDSFPGTLAQITGATPNTTGVWYDDVWDRSLYPPGSGCKGQPGAQVVYDESVDYNSSLLFSGGVDPKKVPQRLLVNGSCINVLPHLRPRVNTIWELAVAAGLKTAYADKHPSYDIVRGQSGKGLTVGYFPEINEATQSYTANVSQCIKYDTLHVNAFLQWLDGQTPSNSEGSLNGSIPSFWGGNFQSVSVGQKTAGYVNGTLNFTAPLLQALNFVDASLGQVVNKLKAKGLYNDTLIIVASKHGQAPIDPSAFRKIDPALVTKAVGVPTASITFDDTALIFLNKSTDASKAAANLAANATALGIRSILYGSALARQGFGNSTTDPAVPDIIVQPATGVIYTTSKSKIAEHGGGSMDDTRVACFVSNPRLQKRTFGNRVETKQIAVTVLKALGLDATLLRGAVIEGTKALGGF